ncbi:unnamed protein product [Mycena citricolor]|nr:unnamed protein product [Mycena citricolor]
MKASTHRHVGLLLFMLISALVLASRGAKAERLAINVDGRPTFDTGFELDKRLTRFAGLESSARRLGASLLFTGESCGIRLDLLRPFPLPPATDRRRPLVELESAVGREGI